MSPLGRMVFPRAPPSGKPSSLGETFHHVTPTGMAYLYNGHGETQNNLTVFSPAGIEIVFHHFIEPPVLMGSRADVL